MAQALDRGQRSAVDAGLSRPPSALSSCVRHRRWVLEHRLREGRPRPGHQVARARSALPRVGEAWGGAGSSCGDWGENVAWTLPCPDSGDAVALVMLRMGSPPCLGWQRSVSDCFSCGPQAWWPCEACGACLVGARVGAGGGGVLLPAGHIWLRPQAFPGRCALLPAPEGPRGAWGSRLGLVSRVGQNAPLSLPSQSLVQAHVT